MKLTKGTLLVLAGVLLAGVLFSFKNDEPKKEYLTIVNIGSKFVIINPDGSQKEVKTLDAMGPTERTKVINDLNATINSVTKEGWVLVESTERKNTGDVLFIFERTKQ
jgi:hypothetical protein